MSSGLETSRDFHIGLEQAWHRQTRVLEVIGADQFPDIIKSPLRYVLPTGEVREWPGMTVPVSGDDGLPVGTASGDSYTLFSPREAMTYLGEVLAGTGHKVESLGMIFNRARWFVTYSLTELEGIAPKGEAFKLTASGGLDKSQSPMFNLTHTVAVCANTVRIARAGRALFSSKLTKGFGGRLEASREALGQTVGMARIWNEAMRGLERTPATVDQAREVYAGEVAASGADLRSSRTAGLLDDLLVGFRRGRGNAGRTRADVLNGFTEVLGQGLVGSTSRRDAFARWQSSEFGGFAERKAAFASAVADDQGWDRLAAAGREALADARRGVVAV